MYVHYMYASVFNMTKCVMDRWELNAHVLLYSKRDTEVLYNFFLMHWKLELQWPEFLIMRTFNCTRQTLMLLQIL